MFSLTDRAWRAISARVRACSVVRADIASREVPANIRKFAPSAVRTPDPTKSFDETFRFVSACAIPSLAIQIKFSRSRDFV
jgi:hypothetical protein